MTIELSKYKTLVFDCDGVVLNSNKIKTQAFYDTTSGFGHDKAQSLVDYHVANGGISRYLKFEYFIENILRQEFSQVLMDDLLKKFALEVKRGLMKSQIADGLHELRSQTQQANWLIVSGGDQNELREVFSNREIVGLFDGGIFGSPDSKDIILKREKENQNILTDALFLGDSKYDFQSADKAGLDFVFVSDWTEVSDWQEFQSSYGFPVINNLSSLLSR